MFRILAASLSAAALLAASLPAAAQQRKQSSSFRGPGQQSVAAKRVSGPKHPAGQRRFRSFNPPAPQISSGQRFHRSFNPPAPFGQASSAPRALSRGLAPPSPGGPTAPQYLYPGAPTGGQHVVGLPSSVPASLPPPSPGEASPTAAAAAPTETAPEGDLQPPLPETVAAQPEPALTAAKEVTLAPDQVIRQVVHVPVPQPIVRQVYEVRVVYVPVYRERRVYRRHHAYVPHYAFHGHRAHFGPRFHRGFRRW